MQQCDGYPTSALALRPAQPFGQGALSSIQVNCISQANVSFRRSACVFRGRTVLSPPILYNIVLLH